MLGLPISVIRLLLFGWGIILLLVGGCDLLAPRARFVDSTPAAGAVLETQPTRVAIRFTEPLRSDSRISVGASFTLTASGERQYGSDSVFTATGLDSADATGRSLSVELGQGLASGVYHVSWRTFAARGNAGHYGTYYFGVGVPVPEDVLRDNPGGRAERDVRQRRRSATIAGGLILIVLALIVRKPR